MDERVDQNKYPDGSRHVTHTSPHAKHGTGVMVGLQGRAEFALGEDNEGVQNFVKLAQVENPAIVVESFVPNTSHLSAAGLATVQAADESIGVRAVPVRRGVVEIQGASQATRTMKAAEAVSSGSNTARPEWAHDAASHATQHAPKGPCRVDSEQHIVKDNKGEEGLGFAHGPRLLVAGGIELVQSLGGHCVQRGNGQWDLGVKSCLVDVVGDVEGSHDRDGHRRR